MKCARVLLNETPEWKEIAREPVTTGGIDFRVQPLGVLVSILPGEVGEWGTFSWLSHSHRTIPNVGRLGPVKQCHNVVREPSFLYPAGPPPPPQHAAFSSWSEMTDSVQPSYLNSSKQEEVRDAETGTLLFLRTFPFWKSYTLMLTSHWPPLLITLSSCRGGLQKIYIYFNPGKPCV